MQRSGRAGDGSRDGRGGAAPTSICPQTFIYNISLVSAENLQSLTTTALATKLMWAKMLNNLEWVLGIDNRVTRKAVQWIALILACRTPQFIMMYVRQDMACNWSLSQTKWSHKIHTLVLRKRPPFFLFPGSVLWGNEFFPPPFFLPPFLIEHVETNQHGFYEFMMWSYI